MPVQANYLYEEYGLWRVVHLYGRMRAACLIQNSIVQKQLNPEERYVSDAAATNQRGQAKHGVRSTEDRRAIVTRFNRRDPSVLEELYDRVSARAFGLAYRVLNDRQAAEDAVQEAFLWIWDNPDRLDPERGSVDALLMTVVHRRAIDAVRAQLRRSALGAEAARARMALDTADIASDAEHSVDAGSIAKLVNELPREQRTAIELAYFQGMTHAEIASEADIPLGTVKSRLRLAMAKLRNSFGPGGSS